MSEWGFGAIDDPDAELEAAIARAVAAEARCARLEEALQFYARREHWMSIGEDGPRTSFVAMKGDNPNGYAVAEAALSDTGEPRDPKTFPDWDIPGRAEHYHLGRKDGHQDGEFNMRERAAKAVEDMTIQIAGNVSIRDQAALTIRALPLTKDKTDKPLPTDFPPPSDALKNTDPL